MTSAVQKAAFEHLRDQVRQAHLADEGLRVNHLAAIALTQFRQLAEAKQLGITLSEVKWACILPMYWLLHDYMLYEVRHAQQEATKLGVVSQSLSHALRTYFWLIEEPSIDVSDGQRRLEMFEFEWCLPEDAVEDCVLLVHGIELLWWHSRGSDHWLRVANGWIARCPKWLRHNLEVTRQRLAIQTRLTHPSPVSPRVATGEIDRIFEVAKLAPFWFYSLDGDSENLDSEVRTAVQQGKLRDAEARLVFDVHHKNRFFGAGGDPQPVGLTRRMLQYADSPALLFHRLRQAQRTELLAQSYFAGSEQSSNSRIGLFQLLKLEEIAALRMWSWGDWVDAVRAEARSRFELCRGRKDAFQHAATGLLLGVRGGGGLSSKRADVQVALRQLELAPPTVLTDLVESLLDTYHRQKRAAWELFHELGDLIPEAQWEAVAKWQVNYLADTLGKKDWPPGLATLALWGTLLPNLSVSSPVWGVLRPEAIRIAKIPWIWGRDDGGFFDAWLCHAPLPLALELGEAICEARDADGADHSRRLPILGNAELHRTELTGRYRSRLLAGAHNWEERIALFPLQTQQEKTATAAEAKPYVMAALEGLLDQAVPSSNETTAFAPSERPQFVSHVRWTKSELHIVQRVVSAVGDPSVLVDYLPALLAVLHDLIAAGPDEFGDYVLPHAERWIQQPPVARKTEERTTAFQLAQPSLCILPDVITPNLGFQLGWIVRALLLRCKVKATNLLETWIQSLPNCDSTEAAPLAASLVLDHGISLPLDAARQCTTTVRELLNGLAQASKNLSEETRILADALESVATSMHSLVSQNGLPESWLPILDWLVGWLPDFGRSADSQIRLHVATVTRLLLKRGIRIKELKPVHEKLTFDNRASVRLEARVEK